ncbi:MAG: hypothetical protein A3F84_15755 [Candidatus Handelsmanbacteria bacterium RIFCSPLOWO2_12_FULL_64_10]|uniref:PTS EIIA type-2 domain-containing protein n=1 Tax=Handelsmanbacteria sp. (strain RIFCSPLOWO2_12_FULL_64_10) TaxID=1817868 RepID=A0A1F6D4W4_HANXR|nr:MAG: hypothetical protein A3F84_15755 [Candidatus Handelsmanbacteria bacterium RIFCSPLOWO2_12_FULL_64_10]
MDKTLTHDMLITVAVALSTGVLLVGLSRRLNLSALVLLLLGGIALGPEGIGVVKTDTLGAGLPVLVSLAVGLILFEGGLTLDVKGYRLAPALIRRLLSVGVLITWLSAAAAIWLIFGFDLSFALLSASFVIVTGPTVIGPLLKRVKVVPGLHHILHWEGVLIDPIGVFVALLCFEWIGEVSGGRALANFGLRFLSGVGIGVAGGFAIYALIRARVVPEDLMNAFALGCAVLIFGVTGALFSEAGLLSVTVAGFVIGLKQPAELKQIRQFKAEMTDLLIGLLFILLAARLRFEQFQDLGARGVLLIGVVFAIRPLNVLVSSWGLGLGWREKVFLGWVAPRGIVAASMASLFTLSLQQWGIPDAIFVETFTYSVIAATVLLNGFTAGPLARALGLQRPVPTGWLIVGAHPFGRGIARFISRAAQAPTVLVDTNPKAVAEAGAEGLVAFVGDARDVEIGDRDESQGVGNLLALTDNEDLNALLCQRWASVFGRTHVFRWSSGRGKIEETHETPGRVVWSHLPKPSLLSGEMVRGEAVVIPSRSLAQGPDNLTSPLVAVRGQAVALDPSALSGSAGEEPAETLYLRREADYLVRSVRPELVGRLDARNAEELFSGLIGLVVRVAPEVPREETSRELLDRERLFPSALGHGVAVPHAYSRALSSRLCAIAQIPDGVDFEAPDGEPVRLVFLLLSPSGDPEGHLATLAEIARIAGDREMRARLMAASHPSELLTIVRDVNPLHSQPAS